MPGELDLDTLIASMEPAMDPRTFVFVTTRDDTANIPSIMRFEEREGTSLIVEAATAQAHKLDSIFACRMITLNVHSSLEAVGFIAKIASHLAAAGMGVNPVSGYFHDHLFVAEEDAGHAMELLEDLVDQGRL